MSFNNFKSNSYCVSGKHFSRSEHIRGDLTQNKKYEMPVKLLRSVCATCKRIKSLIVSDQTIAAEGLDDSAKKD